MRPRSRTDLNLPGRPARVSTAQNARGSSPSERARSAGPLTWRRPESEPCTRPPGSGYTLSGLLGLTARLYADGGPGLLCRCGLWLVSEVLVYELGRAVPLQLHLYAEYPALYWCSCEGEAPRPSPVTRR